MKNLKREVPAKRPVDEGADTFGNIVKLIQSLAWPGLVLLLFIFYRDPFSRTIDQVPDLVGHATEMKVGSVSLEIEQKAESSNDTRLADALKGLSPDARRILLERGDSYMRIWSAVDNHGTTYYTRSNITPGFQELVQRKLVEFIGPRKPDGSELIIPTEKDPKSLHLMPAPGAISYGGNTPPEIFKASEALTPDELAWLNQEEYRLTELGKKAFDVIVDVVTHS